MSSWPPSRCHSQIGRSADDGVCVGANRTRSGGRRRRGRARSVRWSTCHCSVCPGAETASSLARLDDSKKLTERAREELFPAIKRLALAWSVISVPAAEVDQIGIHVANIEGMRRAVAGLDLEPGYVLTDGFRVPGLTAPSLPVIGGDGAAACIAAASVLAKVTRDRVMTEMDDTHPGYGFAIHKGYSTPLHMDALDELGGPCPEHRMTYANVVAAGVRLEQRAGRTG